VLLVGDVYRTRVNDRAAEGALATTSGYGPDADEFANGKPIAPLHGAGLMHLFENYGTKARTNPVEARPASSGTATSQADARLPA
jgi:restriction system protein